MKKVLILGKGRIGRAVAYYLKKLKVKAKIDFFSDKKRIKNYNLLIGALPSSAGEVILKFALKYKKDLIDVSDVDYPFYLKNRKHIENKGILVFPGCGFSPGLTNLICGRETKNNKVKEIEIKAGTLSPKEFIYPFTWCFEDIIEGHQYKPTLIRKGKKVHLFPFSGYQKEKIDGIQAESYFIEGLESMLKNIKVRNMSYRVLRPLGFFYLYKYLENYGFFKKENLTIVKKILEGKREDNITLGIIKIKTENKDVFWKMKAFSKKNEKLNSMQKITAIFPVLLVKEILEGNIFQKGLIFPEELGKDKVLFKKIISQIKKQILLTRT
ncbi:MAG: saccharopine dehydrogenase family protein [Candidatus Nealsonbacteria bacterium]